MPASRFFKLDPPQDTGRSPISRWDNISSPIPGDLSGGINEGPVRLPASSQPGLARFWQIPLYAVAYLIHVRYRRWRPRALPCLTNLTLPEIYGSLALGHAVDIEANRVQDKTFYSREGDPGRHLWYIVRASLVLRDEFREMVGPDKDKEKGSERIWNDITYPGILEHAYGDDSPAPASTDSSLLTHIRKHFSDLEDYCIWELRGLWSNRRARELAGLLLYERIRELGLSAHDARILVTFIAERMYVGRHYVSNLPYKHLLRSQTYRGEIPARLAEFTAIVLLGRLGDVPRSVLWLSTGPQRVFFHLWVCRTLWGRYRHWEALGRLEDPEKAAEVVRLSVRDLDELVERKRGKGREGEGKDERKG